LPQHPSPTITVFKSGKFPEDHIPTIFETDIAKLKFTDEEFIKKEKVDEIEFSLWDTAGQESYDRLRPLSYPASDVVLICFAIDSPDSLANVESQWAKEVKHFCKGVPVILVGNKIDLREDKEMIANLAKKDQILVSTDKTKSMANKISAYAYVECSAKIQQGVQDVFETAAKAALKKNSSLINLPRRCPIL
jgi:Ras family protein A